MARTVPMQASGRGRPRGGGRGKLLGGCLIALVVLGFGGLFGLRAVASGVLASALEKAAPADSWQTALGLLTIPRAIVGLPVDLSLEARQVQLDRATDLRADRLAVAAQGVRLSVAQKKLTGLRDGTFEAHFTAEQVQHLLAAKLSVEGSQLTAAFEGSQLKLVADLQIPGGLGNVPTTILATPQFVAAGKVKLTIDDVKCQLPPGLSLFGISAEQVVSRVSSWLAPHFVADFTVAPGLVPDQVAIVGDRMVLSGKLTEALLGTL